MNRRNFIKVAGGASVIVAATGIGTFISTRTPHAAVKSWKSAGSQYSDPIRKALSYAILAPNPHNRQPWVVDLVSDTEAVLSCDLQRLLPATDPFDRQITIGLGCFLELFAIAATHDGQRAEISLFPEGEPGEHLNNKPIARMKLLKETKSTPDPLFAHTLHRRTNREPYNVDRNITLDKLQEILAVANTDVEASGVVGGDKLQSLRKLTRFALREEIMDAEAFQESIDLMRIGRNEIEANPDGISLGGAFLEGLSLLGMLSKKELADPSSRSFQIGLDMADEQAMTSMGFVWINTLGNNRQLQIAAGRNYLRIALQIAGLGLSMQPMSQALQEYEAMKPHYKQVHQMLTQASTEHVQMLARIGYAAKVPPSPRWELSTRIRNS